MQVAASIYTVNTLQWNYLFFFCFTFLIFPSQNPIPVFKFYELGNLHRARDISVTTWAPGVLGKWPLFLPLLCYNMQIYVIYLVVCLTTGTKPFPKRALQIAQSRASSFKWEYPLLSLRSSNSFLRLLPCLPVTSIPSYIIPSITRCRRQCLRKMWPIKLAFRLRISCRIFLCSLTLSNTSSFLTWSVQLIFSSFSSTTF
jgi:hypothetical protein